MGESSEEEDYISSPSSLGSGKGKGPTSFIKSPQHPNSKAKLKSDRIDALIEKQATEQNNIVKILLLGRFGIFDF